MSEVAWQAFGEGWRMKFDQTTHTLEITHVRWEISNANFVKGDEKRQTTEWKFDVAKRVSMLLTTWILSL